MSIMLLLILVLCFCSVSVVGYMFFKTVSGGYSSAEFDYINRTEAMLNELNMLIAPDRLVIYKIVAGFFSAVIAFGLGIDLIMPVPFVLLALFGVGGFFAPDIILKRMYIRRRAKFNSQLVDTMNSLSNGLKSGFSFQQAIDMTAKQLPDPAGQEFRLAMREAHLGLRLEEALQNMANRLQDDDLALMVAAVKLTLQIGGDLSSVLRQITETIRERKLIDGKINALTSQGKLQATVVGLVPIGLAYVVHLVNPTIMRVLYTTIIGWGLIAAVLGLDILGFFLIRKIVTIKY